MTLYRLERLKKLFKFVKDCRKKKVIARKAKEAKEANLQAQIMHYQGNIERNRNDAVSLVNQLRNCDFLRMFRMTRETFEEVLALVSPILQKQEKYAVRNVAGSKGSSITPRIMLYSTLRFLAGGSYLDICFSFRIAFGSFFGRKQGVLWKTLEALDQVYSIGIPLNNNAEMERITAEFAAINQDSAHVFRDCVMAIDGWICKTRKPYRTEVADVMKYRSRKGCWGFTVLAGSDAKGKFMMFSCVSAGCANDIMAWKYCYMNNEIICKNRLPNKYFCIGDEAFTCTKQFLVPYSGRGIGRDKDSFNYHLSVRRQVIERAFGMMVKRWGVLQRPLNCAHERWSLVATVCAKLHNLCLDKNVPIIPRMRQDIQPGDDYWDIFNNEMDEQEEEEDYDDEEVRTTRVAKRKLMSDTLFAEGIFRPNYAMINSRE